MNCHPPQESRPSQGWAYRFKARFEVMAVEGVILIAVNSTHTLFAEAYDHGGR
jgi:hypothetical protein